MVKSASGHRVTENIHKNKEKCEEKMKELLEHSNWNAQVTQIQFKEMLQKNLDVI